jgi:hypothetical protein
LCGLDHGIHRLVVRRDGARAHAILIRETAGQHVRIERPQTRGAATPVHDLGVETDGRQRAQRFVLAVRSGKDDDRDARAHRSTASRCRAGA